MSTPLISVIIPTHSATQEILKVAIDSIRAQTYPNLELIIIDDSNPNNIKSVVEEYRKEWDKIFYYKLPSDDADRVNKRGRNINAGWSARNYGFEKTHGEWITFQDADDASLPNRIEVQYELAKKYNATHLCIDWQQFNPALLGKKLDAEAILRDSSDAILRPGEITTLAQKTKGVIIPFLGPLNKLIPFEWKRMRGINKLFFGSLESYPGTGNSPLFKREVMEKVKFRSLQERIWPSFMGRGADRDFNFQVSETFKNSFTFFIPLYLWRQDKQNEKYTNYEKYLI